ncbi:hypothetical protein [Enemella sp. A6]|uniref:DODA-type extradiol aromatic ring-opening family dioxygenase n=1 Tax=Enemella sp. A6 TaxID=3440152 RepID=UPI003EC127D3
MSQGAIVQVFATSHSPGIAGWPERAGEGQYEAVMAGYAEVARRLHEMKPDAIIAVSVEHFTNFHLGNHPPFAIATGESYLGPVTEEMARFLKVPQQQYPGHAELGRHVLEFALEAEFDPALIEGGLAFDENFCTPWKYLDPDATIPMVPIIVNGVNPPWPTLRRCYAFGQMLRRAVAAQSLVEKVAVIATGGLSHSVGTPDSGYIDERFDRDFLERLSAGDPDRLVDFSNDEIDAAGNGAHEIRTWLVAAGAAGTPFDVLAYEPVPEWLTGTGVAAARL